MIIGILLLISLASTVTLNVQLRTLSILQEFDTCMRQATIFPELTLTQRMHNHNECAEEFNRQMGYDK